MNRLAKLGAACMVGLLALGSIGCPKDEPAQNPEIVSFSATPAGIVDGDSSTLAWETLHAVSLSLVDDAGNTIDISSAGVANGDVAVSPSATTEYTLTATGGEDTTPATARLTITVAPADVCGDGSVTGPEACDDGNTAAGDYCAADCSAVTGLCGDGTAQTNEACDDGNTAGGDYCSADCQTIDGFCGDGTAQANEACDDGNTTDGDYCSADCQTVDGSCGDGTTQSNEACDDGNTADGDYCSADCQTIDGSCGDGTPQANEACDDGNTADGDYCSADCQTSNGACGDGTVETFEACDDGNTVDGDYCAADCMGVTGSCGDGTTQTNEACDDSGESATCNADCTAHACGDGVYNVTAGEVCDDGNTVDGDYCAADCLSVIGACGDGTQQTNEACDDGNVDAGDYCAADCMSVTGSCGDGTQQTNEECDDGNTDPLDGCAADCTIEIPGSECALAYDLNTNGAVGDGSFTWSADTTNFTASNNASCTVSGNNPEAFAYFMAPADGDYLVAVPSTATFNVVLWVWDGVCDSTSTVLSCVNGTTADGNESLIISLVQGQEIFIVVDGYGNFTDNWGTFDLTVEPDICGDGYVSANEDCDDMGESATCNADCTAHVCGDGVQNVTAGEACDDGNTTAGDYCAADCLSVTGSCGDGTTQTNEDCDTSGESATCDADCTFVVCGDSVTNAAASEACDDGNTAAGDYCAADCLSITGFCGDGAVQTNEVCDDTNTTAGDGCSDDCMVVEAGYVCPTPGSACRAITCGDGFIDWGESCEDGNTADGDGCSATCALEIAAPGASIVATESIDATDMQWARPGSTCGATSPADHYFDAVWIENNTGYPQLLTATAAWSGDGFLHVFYDPFDPADLANCIKGDDDFNGTSGSQIVEIYIMPGESLVLVASTWGGGAVTGAYSLDIATDAVVCGDGWLTGMEACDDSNIAAADGCNDTCSLVEDGYVCDVPGNACVSVPGALVINELDYDQTGSDTTEFVEIFNGTAADVDLTNLAVVFVNGNNNAEYGRYDLSAAGATLPAGGYLVIRNPGLTVDAAAMTIDTSGTSVMQNGAPDGVALIDSVANTLIDALSYEGEITAAVITGFAAPVSLVEGSAATAVDAFPNYDGSMCRRASNGRDTDNASLDWSYCPTPTPGAANP
ncbi:MAG: DUF4215 domain-containing protein [Deltaproteobacteria bacterium]|nr:DUF4215 domain-containing protein [Deltaproteobacteria bacterium]